MLVKTWTDENVALFAKLCAERLSYSEIGARLGISRNAAIGRAHRTGVSNGRHHRSACDVSRPKRQSIVAANVLDPESIPAGQRKSLLELGNENCRFPYGDVGTPGFFFCGHPSANLPDGRPYCNAHAKITQGKSAGIPFVPHAMHDKSPSISTNARILVEDEAA